MPRNIKVKKNKNGSKKKDRETKKKKRIKEDRNNKIIINKDRPNCLRSVITTFDIHVKFFSFLQFISTHRDFYYLHIYTFI